MKYFLLSLMLICSFVFNGMTLPAFPGAEGYGSDTPGGRGGKVFFVTNLSDAGSGSLRAAINATGKRIVVFSVSGTIDLKSDLVVKNPNITIAGQSAPGDGICVKNYKFMISAKDVVVRYLRIRRGNASGAADDALGIADAANVIVDHCSISWGCDEIVNTWHGAENITIQWSIFSEGLHHRDHGFAATLGGNKASYHHNLIANCPGRNPSIGGNNTYQTHNMDFRNSVIYNFGYRTFDGKPNSVNIVNNYFKPGPMSTQTMFANIDESKYQKITFSKWHVSGNVWHGNETITKDNKAGLTDKLEYLVDEPNEFSPVITVSAEEAFTKVMEDVGAQLPKQDVVDARIIKEVKSGTATYGKGIVLSPKDVGGWPELASSPAPADSDKDGMPDSWETKHGLNPDDCSDGPKDKDGNGYTNIEEYLNELVGTTSPTAMIRNNTSDVLQNRNSMPIIVVYQSGNVILSEYPGQGIARIFSLDGRMMFMNHVDTATKIMVNKKLPVGTYIFQFANSNNKMVTFSKRFCVVN